jgi:hypothetical protein
MWYIVCLLYSYFSACKVGFDKTNGWKVQNPERRQNFMQDGANYLYVKWPDFVMINDGQESNTAGGQLKALINLYTKTIVTVRNLVVFL